VDYPYSLPQTARSLGTSGFSWHGSQPRMSLGTYPEISLKEARELRDQARSLVAKDRAMF
jgi:hypothetical protein